MNTAEQIKKLREEMRAKVRSAPVKPVVTEQTKRVLSSLQEILNAKLV